MHDLNTPHYIFRLTTMLNNASNNTPTFNTHSSWPAISTWYHHYQYHTLSHYNWLCCVIVHANDLLCVMIYEHTMCAHPTWHDIVHYDAITTCVNKQHTCQIPHQSAHTTIQQHSSIFMYTTYIRSLWCINNVCNATHHTPQHMWYTSHMTLQLIHHTHNHTYLSYI